jgi:hypothetical protein
MNTPELSTATTFKNWKGTEFFHYNHLTGTMVMVVNDGCIKGLYTRCDSQAANLARQYHRSMEHGVAPEKRLWDPCKMDEFHNQFALVTEYLHEQSTQALLTTI